MQIEQCLGVPLYIREIRGKSRNTSLVYQHHNDGGCNDDNRSDEVEDLYELLQHVTSVHPEIEAVSSGAILSTYQRTRIENVCSRLGLTSLAYCWRMGSQSNVLDSILSDEQMEAVLVRVACPPGLTCRHLGRSLRTLRDDGTLDTLYDKLGMHVAGEGGEYETLVLDCQLFRFGRLVLEEVEVVPDCSGGDGVGILRIKKCRVEKKEGIEGEMVVNQQESPMDLQHDVTTRVQNSLSSNQSSCSQQSTTSIPKQLLQSAYSTPNIRIMRGGLCHLTAILSPTSRHATNKTEEAQFAVDEFLSILQIIQQILNRLSTNKISPQNDILFVHLYLSQISHFGSINTHYQQFFGLHLPPSRSCVGVGHNMLPGGRRVMMDCVLQLGSGEYLRMDESKLASMDQNGQECGVEKFVRDACKNKHHSLRKTLHVQSISNWAPVCIGPYSQANTWRSSLIFIAGMIGLVPQSMTLIQPSFTKINNHVQEWEVQLYQSWRNAASVLDGLEDGGGKLNDIIGGLVYFSLDALKAATCSEDKESNHLSWYSLWEKATNICNEAIIDNGGIVTGSVDGTATAGDPSLYDEDGVLYGGYEDEETWREMTGATTTSTAPTGNRNSVPLLMVCLSELPMNAQAEVELVCASKRAADSLGVYNGKTTTFPIVLSASATEDCDMLWDTGYNYSIPEKELLNETQHIYVNCVSRCLGDGCVCISTVTADVDTSSFDPNNFDIEELLDKMVDTAITSAWSNSDLASPFNIRNVLNLRLYYIAASSTKGNLAKPIEIDVIDDGEMLRTLLYAVLAAKSRQFVNNFTLKRSESGMMSTRIPAYTVVPTIGMYFAKGLTSIKDRAPFLAMQVTLVDARTETEMWIRHRRD